MTMDLNQGVPPKDSYYPREEVLNFTEEALESMSVGDLSDILSYFGQGISLNGAMMQIRTGRTRRGRVFYGLMEKIHDLKINKS